ncbi:MAG: dihydroxyacetone kinase subunit DhaL [Caldilineaceae bacterium]
MRTDVAVETELTLVQVRGWLLRYADRIDECAPILTELDAAIGDADHGANMVRGMARVRARLTEPATDSGGFPSESLADIGSLLRTVAMTLISSVGGAAGPLYGAFFLRAARDPNHANKGKAEAAAEVVATQEVSVAQLAAMFQAGVEGVQQRGKAHLNEKTMLDVLAPAAAALSLAAEQGATLAAAVDAARAAAEAGLHHTIDLEALKGRASYLGPRSIGHQDPGATSSYYLIESLAWAVSQPAPAG